MMRSMSSAVSGLKAMQVGMDVIGNNIANVNTTGYKKSRVVFADTLYQAMRGAGAPTGTTGGTNPMAVGLGAKVAAIQQIHEGAPAAATNNVTDMAIDGDGYFVLRDSNGQTCYSRAGNFNFDTNGNLVNSDGFLVQGWVADPATGALDTAVSNMRTINIASFETTAPKVTTWMAFKSGNLDSEIDSGAAQKNDLSAATPFNEDSDFPADDTYVEMQKEFYDSLGNKHTAYYRFFKVIDSSDPTATHWNCDVTLDPANFDPASGASIEALDFGDTSAGGDDIIRYKGILFNSDGSLNTSSWTELAYTVTGTNGAADQNITFELTGLTQYSADSDYDLGQYVDSSKTGLGCAPGNLTNISVGTDGVIRGTYDNGTSQDLVQVALATFQNTSGLIQGGSNTFLASVNSGDAVIGTPGAAGRGTIIPSSLENSNVDLSEEFTAMITTQRGFQANSRVITTSDSMLEELVNLKRG